MTNDESFQAASALRQGTARLARRLRMERPESDVAPLELAVLGHLARRGPLTAGEIAAAERVQPQTMTRALAALEANGYVNRSTDAADRRRSPLSITDAGRHLLTRDMRHRDRWLRQAMAAELTDTEHKLLALAGELMERLAEADVSTGGES